MNHVVRKLRQAFPYRQKKGIKPKQTNKKTENEESESDEDSETEFFAKKTRRKLKGKSQIVELPRVSLNA